MKLLPVILFCAGSLAADDRLSRMLDEKLTAAQRNDACFALRGDRSPDVLSAMRIALASEPVRACAGRNLREAGAVDQLKNALLEGSPEARAIAARELGSFEKPELIDLLVKTAHDSHPLVATNAVTGLAQYEDRAVLPHLLALCDTGGIVGVAALSRAAQFKDPAVLPVARKTLAGSDIAMKLIAVRILGDMGSAADLPLLRDLVATSKPLPVRGRGFGLMPAVDLSRVARKAISEIEKRQLPGK